MSEIEITKSASSYLKELLEKQDENTVGIKIFVTNAGTPRAETCIAYTKDSDDLSKFVLKENQNFNLYLEEGSLNFLEDAKVDYSPDKFGGNLTIKAPNAKLPLFSDDGSLEEKINYFLYSEINPGHEAHGGEGMLVEILEDNTAVLQFGGGCQGCGMVDLTLKDWVEKTLMEKIPELTKVLDITDHSNRENAYYK